MLKNKCNIQIIFSFSDFVIIEEHAVLKITCPGLEITHKVIKYFFNFNKLSNLDASS